MVIKTFLTDLQWQRVCKKRLDVALQDKGLAMKILTVLVKNVNLRREVPKSLYHKVLRAVM